MKELFAEKNELIQRIKTLEVKFIIKLIEISLKF